mmetsp:Transcript_11720/g.18800  ORF Transcript_11720/g.18800 Transcript_11720/m.18800 type:complete len:96 (+) Transcript_11720:343-630(+)
MDRCIDDVGRSRGRIRLVTSQHHHVDIVVVIGRTSEIEVVPIYAVTIFVTFIEKVQAGIVQNEAVVGSRQLKVEQRVEAMRAVAAVLVEAVVASG